MVVACLVPRLGYATVTIWKLKSGCDNLKAERAVVKSESWRMAVKSQSSSRCGVRSQNFVEFVPSYQAGSSGAGLSSSWTVSFVRKLSFGRPWAGETESHVLRTISPPDRSIIRARLTRLCRRQQRWAVAAFQALFFTSNKNNVTLIAFYKLIWTRSWLFFYRPGPEVDYFLHLHQIPTLSERSHMVLKIISVSILTYAGMKTGFHAMSALETSFHGGICWNDDWKNL